jgi:hypothetical protein
MNKVFKKSGFISLSAVAAFATFTSFLAIPNPAEAWGKDKCKPAIRINNRSDDTIEILDLRVERTGAANWDTENLENRTIKPKGHSYYKSEKLTVDEGKAFKLMPRYRVLQRDSSWSTRKDGEHHPFESCESGKEYRVFVR